MTIKHVGPFKHGITTVYVSEAYYERFGANVKATFPTAEPYIGESLALGENVPFVYAGTPCIVRYYPGLRCGVCTHLELEAEQQAAERAGGEGS